ncbi:uncharacterized protein LOC144444792 [Glandiceps talaboti]
MENKDSSPSLDTIFNEAGKLSESGKICESEKLYSRFIEQLTSGSDTNRPEIASKLALAYNNRGQQKYLQVEFKRAIADYTQAIELQSDLAIAFYNRGQIHYRLSRFDEAITDFHHTLKLEPGFEEVQIALNAAIQDKDAYLKRQQERS